MKYIKNLISLSDHLIIYKEQLFKLFPVGNVLNIYIYIYIYMKYVVRLSVFIY